MDGFNALGALPLGAVDADPTPVFPGGDNQFDWFQTIISQYANSPVILQLISDMAGYINANADLDAFYNLVWNVDTAQGYGLDIWGRIVGVERIIQVAIGDYLGWDQQAEADTFDYGIFYGGATLTNNFALSDTAYRQLILAKALANISDGSIPSINQILINLFPGHGNCYVTDGLDMTMTYTFGTPLNPVENSIVNQSGILPKPAGVSATIVQ